MESPLSPRNAVNIPGSVRHRLHTYTLAASAAGVTMLALAPLGEAEIIYTPANLQIHPIGTYTLDVNNDGTTDFTFFDTYYDFLGTLNVRGVGSNRVALAEGVRTKPAAEAIRSGRGIGPRRKFGVYNSSLVMASGWYNLYPPYNYRCGGPWKDKQNRYLGLKFMIGGEVHYGWARLSETCFHGNYHTAVLTGYAYETIANKSIKAGQEQGTDEGVEQPEPAELTQPAQRPATLGMLARGSGAVVAWRQPAQAGKQEAP